MSWNQQAEVVFKAMTEAQEKMWTSWLEVLKSGPASPPFFQNPFGPLQELAAQELKDWTEDTGQVAKDVAERLMTTQGTVMRMLELSLRTWQAIAPDVESGQDWQASLAKHGEQVRQQLSQFPQGMNQTAQGTGELWRLYLEEWQKLAQPWARSLRRAPWHFGQFATGDSSALIEMTNVYWDAYERTFGRLLESPSLGHTRELSQDLVKGFQAWIDSRRASFEYQVLVTDAWSHTFEQFMRQVVVLAEKGDPVPTLRKLLYVWIDVIEDVFTGLFRSEEYIQKQSQLVNTVSAYKLIERDLVEALLKTSHIPSRSELDEAYRRIYELRREVKDLKKLLHELKGQPPVSASPSRVTKSQSRRS